MSDTRKSKRDDNEKRKSTRTSKVESEMPRLSRQSHQFEQPRSENEPEDSSDKYKTVSKQLLKDKNDLKSKLKRITNEIDNQSAEHKIEMEKFQDYFQNQIIQLAEEKEKLMNELSLIKLSLVEEKERHRLSFENKLLKYKEIVDKKCFSRDNLVKKLENSLVILQDKLTFQQEEKEGIENTYKENEEKFRQLIAELQDQIRRFKEQKLKEQKPISENETKMIIVECEKKIFEKEKEFMNIKLKYQKENGELQDINDVLKNQLLTLQNNFKKIQEGVNGIMASNLSKQKESFEKELFLKTTTIDNLEKKLSKIGEESVTRFNTLENENTRLKSLNTENEKTILKQKELIDKFIEKTKILVNEKEALQKIF